MPSLLVSTRLLYTQRCKQAVAWEVFVSALMTDNTIDRISSTLRRSFKAVTKIFTGGSEHRVADRQAREQLGHWPIIP
jgi:hypothetical protein